MSSWTADELDRIGSAHELAIASRREDGTLSRPTPIWVVRVGDELYVRSWRGANEWYRGTQLTHEGHISAGGVEKDVTFAAADDVVSDAVDAAYRSKYASAGSRYVDPMVRPEAQATTLKLLPH